MKQDLDASPMHLSVCCAGASAATTRLKGFCTHAQRQDTGLHAVDRALQEQAGTLFQGWHDQQVAVERDDAHGNIPGTYVLEQDAGVPTSMR